MIRYLTVRVDEHEEGPSAMMRKADRDRDRDDRGGGFRGDREGGFRGDRAAVVSVAATAMVAASAIVAHAGRVTTKQPLRLRSKNHG